jgi:hypothetical protein
MSNSMTKKMHELSVSEVTEVAGGGGGLKQTRDRKLLPTLGVPNQASSTAVLRAASVSPPRT